MAGRPLVNCCGPSYHLADRKAAIQSAYNLYPQRLDGDRLMMASAPGRVLLTTLPGPICGSYAIGARWFVATDEGVYEVNPQTGAFRKLCQVAAADGFVGMSHNQSQLVAVDGANLYVIDIETTAATRISENFRGSEDVHELDGYMIFVEPRTQQFYLSKIDDASVLDALDFSSADVSPDDVVTHRVSHRQLFLFGELSTEIWVNSGDNLFPLVRYQSYTIDVGCVGPRAAVNAADTLLFIGCTERGTGIVYMLSGNTPQRVSNLAVEEALRQSTDLSKATMWAYQVEGHEFVGINAPGMETTWVFDAAMPPGAQWHERPEWSDGWRADRARHHTFVGDAHFCGDADGKLYRLDAAVNNLAGLPLARERTWPAFASPQAAQITFRELDLSCATGAGSGSVSLQISNDSGYTFGPSLTRELGAHGRRTQRVRWMPLGTTDGGEDRVMRLRCTDDVPFAIYSAALDSA